MTDFKEIMKRRTRQVAVAILLECKDLPKDLHFTVVSKQLMRSATSIGANYRAACRAKSRADFISKMHVVEEECDESIYWVEILEDLVEVKSPNIAGIRQELVEILSIVVTALKSAKGITNHEKIRNCD